MISKFKTWILKWQSCPTSKDLKNEDLKKLAERLKEKSEKETLTNILEWQDRNLQFWLERWPFASLLVRVFVVFVGVLSLYWLFPILYPILFPLIRPILYGCLGGCLGTFIFALVYLSIRYWRFLREKSVKEKICKFIKEVYDTFRLSLPVEKIVKKYRAVCRDYAKLTTALLFSIYPNSKVYFFVIWGQHAASAVKINGEYYVLDQKLPLLTKNGWLNNWNRKDTEVYVSELIRNSEGIPIDVTFDYQEQINRKSKLENPEVRTEELTERIADILGIEQSPQRNEAFEITLDDYAIYYDDDEITKYSLIRAIKNRFEGELCGNIDKVSKIEINQNKKENGKDLIIKVYFDSEPIPRPQ